MKTILAIAAGCGMGAGALAVAFAFLPPPPAAKTDAPVRELTSGWTEVKWPFPMDQWGQGKAFICKAADCGAEISVYVRAKIGFCNCTTGVSDDAELDRVNDVELFGSRFAPTGPGQAIAVAHMKGRSRSYTVDGARGPGREVLAVAFNERCDVIVATAVADRSAAPEKTVLAFLNGDAVLRWAEKTLGL